MEEQGTGTTGADAQVTTLEAPETALDTETSEKTPAVKAERSAKMNDILVGITRKGSTNGRKSASPPTDQASSQSSSESPSDDQDEPITLTRSELAKKVQSEVDRREAKRNQDEQRRQSVAQTQARIAQLRADPVESAHRQADELEAKLASDQRLATVAPIVEDLSSRYDRAVLDPIFQALPKAKQEAILQENAHLESFEHRAALTKAGLSALKELYKAEGAKEAEQALRSNPAFRKELLAELRGERDEPISVASVRQTPKTDMNAFLLGRRPRSA